MAAVPAKARAAGDGVDGHSGEESNGGRGGASHAHDNNAATQTPADAGSSSSS
jgi:hypothetical protein